MAADAPFEDKYSLLCFLGDHEIAHRGITAGLQQGGAVVTMSLPITEGALVNSDWMLGHYQVHREIGSILGQTVPDLSGYDLSNESQYHDWMELHGQLHEQINAALGITS